MGEYESMKVTEWVIAVIILIAVAAVCCFVLKGYSFLGCTFLLIAVMIIIYHVCSPNFWRICVFLAGAGLVVFTFLEIPIVMSSRTDKDCEREYIIVLGAEVVGSSPSRSLNYRIQAAYEYLVRYPSSVAVVSGGAGPGEEITEAQCMYDNLVRRGISPDRIIQENRSTSTRENLTFSFNLIRENGENPNGNVAILSSSYHLFRAKKLSERLGVEAVGVACYPGNPFLAANFFIREAFGVARLLVLGY